MFLRLFKPSFSSDKEAEGSQMSKIPTSGPKPSGWVGSSSLHNRGGSGKTYTMEGGPGIEEDETQCGVIPRTIRQIFDIKKKLVEKSWSYKLTVSVAS